MNSVMLATLAAAVSVSVQPQSDGSRTLVQETIVDAPLREVWTAISTAEGWKTWAAPVAWQTQPDLIETSYNKDANPGDKTTIRQKILAQVPERLLLFRTVKAPQGFPDFETYEKVVHLLEVEEAGQSRTRIRLTGAGYAPTDAGNRLLAFFEKGNVEVLKHMQARFGKNTAPDVAGDLAAFDFLVGHCFVGEAPQNAGVDRHCFERVFGGRHVRDRHSVTTGGREIYAGETIYSVHGPDVIFTYWNSLGGLGTGEAVFAVDEWRFSGSIHASATSAEQPMAAVWRKVGTGYEVRQASEAAPRLFKRSD
ncbi:MAG: SRPBCC domain-containing protein [Sphingomicrobium sp.]